jgi:hypothetical protein
MILIYFKNTLNGEKFLKFDGGFEKKRIAFLNKEGIDLLKRSDVWLIEDSEVHLVIIYKYIYYPLCSIL